MSKKKVGLFGVGNGSPLQEYKRRQLGKNKMNPQQQRGNKNKKWIYSQSKFHLECFSGGKSSSSRGITMVEDLVS
jgi:hypothetical protein